MSSAFLIGASSSMTKIAERLSAEKREDAGIGAAAGLIGSSLATKAVSPHVGQAIVDTMKPSQIHLSEAMTRDMKRRLGVSGTAHRFIENARHGSYDLVRNIASAPRQSGEIMAHELGHASANKNKLWRGLNISGRTLGPAAGVAAGGAMALVGERGSKTTRLAPLVAASGWLPTLVDEGVASVKGYRALKATPGVNSKSLRTARTNLLKAFGTYGAAAAIATLPVAAISASRWKKKEKRRG